MHMDKSGVLLNGMRKVLLSIASMFVCVWSGFATTYNVGKISSTYTDSGILNTMKDREHEYSFTVASSGNWVFSIQSDDVAWGMSAAWLMPVIYRINGSKREGISASDSKFGQCQIGSSRSTTLSCTAGTTYLFSIRASGDQTMYGYTIRISPASTPPSPYVNLSPTSATKDAYAGTGSITVSANTTWTASSSDSWITISGGKSGSGNGTVNYSFTANSSTSSRTGYIYVGYSSGNASFRLTQSGKTVSTYTITYKPGTYGSGSQETATKTQGKSIELEGSGMFERTGYSQDGWSKNPSGSTLDYYLSAMYSTDASITLYPHWKPQLKSISIQGASSVDSGKTTTYTCIATYYDGTTKTVTPTWSVKTGSSYASINSSGKLTAKTVSTSCSVTIAAEYGETYDDSAAWKDATKLITVNPPPVETYTITYDPGAYGTGTRQTATKTEGVTLTLKGALFTRTGYTQTGWTFKEDRGKDYELNDAYSWDSAATLYPYWTANTYTVSYSLGGGSFDPLNVPPASVSFDWRFSVQSPTRSGYSFAGWSVTSGLDTSTAYWVTEYWSDPPEKTGGVGDHETKTPITSSSMLCTEDSDSRVMFRNLTPVANGSVTLTANWAPASVDLICARFETWDNLPILVHAGELSGPDTPICIDEDAYAQITVKNDGEGVAKNFHVSLTLDGKEIRNYFVAELSENAPFDYRDEEHYQLSGRVLSVFKIKLGKLSAGTHTLVLTVDSANEVVESDETNNSFTKVFVVDEKQSTSASEFSLSQGWTWMSVNVEPEDPSVASVFRGVSFADNDVIKSSDGSATYYDGNWYPSPATFKLVAGRAYAVKKSTAGDATVTVSGTSATSSIAVTAGWNWIGLMTGNSVSRDALKHSGGFTDNDVISSASSSATYYGGTWYGSLQTLEPGVGYKAKFGKAGTLTKK